MPNLTIDFVSNMLTLLLPSACMGRGGEGGGSRGDVADGPQKDGRPGAELCCGRGVCQPLRLSIQRRLGLPLALRPKHLVL